MCIRDSIRYFLQSQKITKLREAKERKIALARYKNQFRNENYFAAEFPTNPSELKIFFTEVKLFIEQRIRLNGNNTSFIPDIKNFLNQTEFQSTEEYIEMLALYGFFFTKDSADTAELKTHFNRARKEIPDFNLKWLNLVLRIHSGDLVLDPAADSRMSDLVDKDVNDEISELYSLLDEIHSKGYLHDDAIEGTKVFYNAHPGKSAILSLIHI